MKKTAQPEVELTKDKDDKHPFRRKQQIAVSDEGFKEKNVETKLQLAHAQAEALKLRSLNNVIEKKARRRRQ